MKIYRVYLTEETITESYIEAESAEETLEFAQQDCDSRVVSTELTGQPSIWNETDNVWEEI